MLLGPKQGWGQLLSPSWGASQAEELPFSLPDWRPFRTFWHWELSLHLYILFIAYLLSFPRWFVWPKQCSFLLSTLRNENRSGRQALLIIVQNPTLKTSEQDVCHMQHPKMLLKWKGGKPWFSVFCGGHLLQVMTQESLLHPERKATELNRTNSSRVLSASSVRGCANTSLTSHAADCLVSTLFSSGLSITTPAYLGLTGR